MSYHDSFVPSSPPVGPPPRPPPKPHSQDPSRTATPMASSPAFQQQHSYPPQYSQTPVPLHSSQPQRSPSQQHPQSSGPPLPHQTHPSQSQYQGQPQQPQPSVPSLPTAWDLPESITKHPTSDLASLLSNPALLSAFAQQHPAYAASLQPVQAQIASNLSLAQQVTTLEGQVKQLRDQTAQLMLQHTSLQTQWRRKQTETDEALAPWGPRAMYQRLVAGINEQEALLRAVHDSFIEGAVDSADYGGAGDGKATEKDVTDWIKRIREGTAVLEKRREMRARWDEGRVGGWR